jgi:hypothetical protein
VRQARGQFQGSVTKAIQDRVSWTRLITEVGRIVCQMPLWKLQTVGSERLDFLYENTGRGRTITLRPGVAYGFRKFYGLVTELVQGAWARYVRRFNPEVLGDVADLREFLFGSERANLTEIAPVMRDFQEGQCFYCDGNLTPAATHVDHFIPWSRYPVDERCPNLGFHNRV